MRQLIASIALLTVGCATTGNREVENAPDAGSIGLESARLVYSQSDALESGEVRQASYDPAIGTATRVLALTYPHPKKGDKFALAEVVVANANAKSARRRGGTISRWLDKSLPGVTVGEDGTLAHSLTIEKSKLDDVLRGLAAKGLLEPARGLHGPDQLLVSVNGRSRSVTVERDQALVALTDSVVAEGQLIRVDNPRVARLLQSTNSAPRDTFYDELLK